LPSFLPYLGEDKELIAQSVKTDGLLLRYASSELKDSMDISLSAVRENRHPFGFQVKFK
jgi:hypothetical protein